MFDRIFFVIWKVRFSTSLKLLNLFQKCNFCDFCSNIFFFCFLFLFKCCKPVSSYRINFKIFILRWKKNCFSSCMDFLMSSMFLKNYWQVVVNFWTSSKNKKKYQYFLWTKKISFFVLPNFWKNFNMLRC